MPDKLREEVNTAADGDRLDARKTALNLLISELAFKAKLTVSTSAEWAELKGVCDAADAVQKYIDAKIVPLGTLDAAEYKENAQLGDAINAAVQLATVLDNWPAGMKSLAVKQSGLQGALKSMVQSDMPSFQSAAGDFSPIDVQGIGALLWMRMSIKEIDLASSIVPAAECAVLMNDISSPAPDASQRVAPPVL